MNDFAAYIPVVNRADLLHQCIESAKELADDLTVIDNSEDGWVSNSYHHGNGVQHFIYTPAVPMTFTQSMNFEFKDTVAKGKKFCVHMHSDAVIPEGAITKLLEAARLVESQGRKWGVIYTLYDVLCVYNPEAYLDIGGYDTNFAAYFSDQDWYHRLDLAGYERIDTGIEVGHIGSQTINSDPYLRHVNTITFPLYREYYVAKWGGEPGHETFAEPFNLNTYAWVRSGPLAK